MAETTLSARQQGGMKMKKNFIGFVVILLLTFFSSSALAQHQPSSKSAVQVSNLVLLSETSNSTASGQWVNLLSANLKTANKKDLLVFVSLECGLYGRTIGRTRGGTTVDTLMANSGVKVRVLIDGVTVGEPGEITLCRKTQTLSTQLAQAISACTDVNLDGVVSIPEECTFTEQQLDLILDSLQGVGFNFALLDLSPGVHSIQLQARIDINLAAPTATDVEARATIGKGTLIVEEVRLIKDADITL
jgi:hypothetical protein